MVTQFGQTTVTTYVACAQCMDSPQGLAVDASGGLYVADSENNRVLYFPYDSSTGRASTTPSAVYGQAQDDFVGRTSDNCPQDQAYPNCATSLSNPWDVAVDGHGGLYVVDTGNYRVLYYPPSNGGGPAQTTATAFYGQPAMSSLTDAGGGPSRLPPRCLPLGASPWTVLAGSMWRIQARTGCSTTRTTPGQGVRRGPRPWCTASRARRTGSSRHRRRRHVARSRRRAGRRPRRDLTWRTHPTTGSCTSREAAGRRACPAPEAHSRTGSRLLDGRTCPSSSPAASSCLLDRRGSRDPLVIATAAMPRTRSAQLLSNLRSRHRDSANRRVCGAVAGLCLNAGDCICMH